MFRNTLLRTVVSAAAAVAAVAIGTGGVVSATTATSAATPTYTSAAAHMSPDTTRWGK